MRSKIVIAIASLFSFATLAMATEESVGLTQWDHTPEGTITDDLLPGQYIPGAGDYFFQVEVRPWADQRIMTGYTAYGNNYLRFDVDLFKALNSASNRYEGRGDMIQQWNDGLICHYAINVEAFPVGRQLYIRHYAPSAMYSQRPAGSPCPPPAGAYIWTRHPSPYELANANPVNP